MEERSVKRIQLGIVMSPEQLALVAVALDNVQMLPKYKLRSHLVCTSVHQI